MEKKHALNSALQRSGVILFLMILGVCLIKSVLALFPTYHSYLTIGMIRYAQVIELLVFLGAIFIYPNRNPAPRMVCTIMMVFFGVFLFAVLVVPYIEDKTLANLVYYATITLFGIASALFCLSFAQMFTRFEPKTSALLFAIVQLITNATIAVVSNFDTTVLYRIMVSFSILGGFCFTAAFILQYRHPEVQPDVQSYELIQAPSKPVVKVFSYAPEWTVMMVTVLTISTLYGMTARVSTITCAPFQIHDIYTSLILFMFDTALVVFMYVKGGNYSFSMPLVIVSFLFFIGYGVFSYVCDNESILAGALIRCGYDCSSVMLVALIARIAHRHPQNTYFYFGLYFFFSSNLLGNALGDAIIANVQYDAAIVNNLSILALMVMGILLAIVLLCCTYFLNSRRTGIRGGFYVGFTDIDEAGAEDAQALQDVVARDITAEVAAADRTAGQSTTTQQRSTNAATGASPKTNAAPQAPATTQEGRLSGLSIAEETLLYQRKIEMFVETYHLTERETSILVETLHGLNRASVAKKLYLSPETVKAYLSSIYRKCGVSSRQEMIALVNAQVPPEE